MVSATLAVLSALALVASAEASILKTDFVRDVVLAGRRLDAHDSMDVAGCDKECPGFMKMLMEVGPALMVEAKEGTPEYNQQMEAAIKEKVCPRKDEAVCPMEKCDAGTKMLIGSLACVCECDGIMTMGEVKTEEDAKKMCPELNKAWGCISSKSQCKAMKDAAPPEDVAMIEKACPAAGGGDSGGGKDSSFASPRVMAMGSASLAAMLTAAVAQV